MEYLSTQAGPFPIGLWIVLVILGINGFLFTLFAQGLSLIKWETALSLGLQEDSPQSSDPVERTMSAISWGEAGADVVVQGTLVVLTFAGILWRLPIGYYTGIVQAVIWIYVCLMVLFQRLALYRLGVVPDLSRFKRLAPLMILLTGIPGLVMLVCLIANQGYFSK